jgi:translation initiation factor eIF-2B subunit delta
VNGASEPQKKKEGPDHGKSSAVAGATPTAASGEQKLSGAELKKLKAAEKAARRKEKISERLEPVHGGPMQIQTQTQTLQPKRRPSVGKKDNAPLVQHKRTGSSSAKAPPPKGTAAGLALEPEKKPKEDKRVGFFSHLYPKDRRTSIAGASKEIHPAVLALGLQLRDHVICGGNARCVATLLVFKKVQRSVCSSTILHEY